MMSIEAMKQWLEALESYHGYMEPLTTVFGGPRVPAEQSTTGKVERAITSLHIALEEALAKQEPVAQHNVCIECRNADSWGLPDKPICRECVRNSKWQPLNESSTNPVYTHPYASQPKREQDEAYKAAAYLAKAIFDSLYANKEPYVSGKVVWELCDTTVGVITQIDNMVSQFSPRHTQPKREWVGLTDEDIRKLAKENIYVLNAIIATNTKLKELNT